MRRVAPTVLALSLNYTMWNTRGELPVGDLRGSSLQASVGLPVPISERKEPNSYDRSKDTRPIASNVAALAEGSFAPLAAVWKQQWTLKTDDVATAGAPSREVDR